MSASTRPRVRATFPIGPWIPGAVLPVAIGLAGALASLLVLQDALLLVGIAFSVFTAFRVRTPAPWLLVALLVVGQLLRDPAGLGDRLQALQLQAITTAMNKNPAPSHRREMRKPTIQPRKDDNALNTVATAESSRAERITRDT